MGATNRPSDISSDVTVLVIDDSKTVRQSASGFLSDLGCTVITAEDGFDALAKVVECQPSMVFADIMMPRLDGYQTCALIKNNPDYKDTPVVMLSSKDGLFDRARGKVVGANDHLAKPFTRDELKQAVQLHLMPAMTTDELDQTVAMQERSTELEPADGDQ